MSPLDYSPDSDSIRFWFLLGLSVNSLVEVHIKIHGYYLINILLSIQTVIPRTESIYLYILTYALADIWSIYFFFDNYLSL